MAKTVKIVGNYGLDDDVIGMTGAEIRTGDFIRFIDDEGFHEVILVYGTSDEGSDEDNTYKVTRDFFTQDSRIRNKWVVSPKQRSMHLEDGKEGLILASMLWGDRRDD